MPFALHAPHGRKDRFRGCCTATRCSRAIASARRRSVRFDRRLCHDKGFVAASMTAPQLRVTPSTWFCVHLEPFRVVVRRSQILELATALGARRQNGGGRPLVVMGDMNTSYGDATRGVGLLATELGLRTWRPEEADAGPMRMSLPSRALSTGSWPRRSSASWRRRRSPIGVSDHAAVVAEIAWS